MINDIMDDILTGKDPVLPFTDYKDAKKFAVAALETVIAMHEADKKNGITDYPLTTKNYEYLNNLYTYFFKHEDIFTKDITLILALTVAVNKYKLPINSQGVPSLRK